jgi:hypothetical protein
MGSASIEDDAAADATNTPRKKRLRGPTLIDVSRSTNIQICLASFKSRGLTATELAAAVDRLDISVLTCEDLLRLKDILPTDAEKKTLLARIKRPTEDLLVLHDSEKCLFELVRVEDSKAKLEAMLFAYTCQVCLYIWNACFTLIFYVTYLFPAGYLCPDWL